MSASLSRVTSIRATSPAVRAAGMQVSETTPEDIAAAINGMFGAGYCRAQDGNIVVAEGEIAMSPMEAMTFFIWSRKAA